MKWLIDLLKKMFPSNKERLIQEYTEALRVEKEKNANKPTEMEVMKQEVINSASREWTKYSKKANEMLSALSELLSEYGEVSVQPFADCYDIAERQVEVGLALYFNGKLETGLIYKSGGKNSPGLYILEVHPFEGRDTRYARYIGDHARAKVALQKWYIYMISRLQQD